MPTRSIIRLTLAAATFLLAAVLPSFATTPLPATATAPQTSSAPASRPVDVAREANEYRRILEALTDARMQGRGAGTEGIDKARDYIESQMRAIGLAPAIGEGYEEPFPATLGTRIKEQSLSVLDESGKVLCEGKSEVDFNNLGITAGEEFTASAVFAGYGIVNPAWGYNNYSEAPDRPVKGKAVVAFRHEPVDEKGKSLWAKGESNWTDNASLNHKVQQALKQGAAALILVDPLSQRGPLMSLEEMTFGVRSKIPVIHVSQDFFRRMLRHAGKNGDDFARLQRDADEGNTDFVDLKGIQIRGKSTPQSIEGKLFDVVGVLPGSGNLRDEVVVVGAHYDHLGLRPRRPSTAPATSSSPAAASGPAIETLTGADDNASGTTGMLTLARWMAKSAPKDDVPQRTIVFVAFSGEELGLLGSAYMVKHMDDLKLKPEQVNAMLNFDMIGRLRDGKLQVLGVDSGDQWRQIIAGVKLPDGMTLKLGSSGTGPSDHASFYSQKIPVLHFYTGMHTDVHSTRDTPDKINCEGAVEVLQVAQQVLLDVARRPERMKCLVPGPKSRPSAATKPYMGVVLAASDSRVKGCTVNDVNDDSPAKSAGLQSGDVITRWDDAAIGKVADFFSKLESSEVGKKVKLTIIRDGKEQTLDVTLGGQ